MTTLLEVEQAAPRRPFTSTSYYDRDLKILATLLADLRAHIAAIDAEITQSRPYQRTSWKIGMSSSFTFRTSDG